jgi:hypothetical protein
MMKRHLAADLEQTGRPRRCQRPGRNPELRRGVPQKLWITERLCRRHQQQRWVSSGNDSSCRRKLSSIRADRDNADVTPNPPASCAGERPCGNSNNAKGLPLVATIRSRTRSSNRPGTTEANIARASPLRRPRTSSSGSPRNSSPGSRREQNPHRLSQKSTRDERHRLCRSRV